MQERGATPMVLGIAGTYCSGKSTAARFLVRQGFHEIDVDKIGHRALLEKAQQVAELFGTDVIGAAGIPDRARIGAIVFADPQALADLESVLHPRMVELVKEELAGYAKQDCVINAALLFPMGLHRLCDRVIWLDAFLPLRLLRGLRRDKSSLKQILRRMRNQRRLRPKFSSSEVDIDTVRNSGSHQALEKKLGLLVRNLRTE